MKTHLIISIGICLLSLSSTMVQARVSKQYLKWARGEFEVPPKIKKVENVSELQPFLQDKREFTRMSAVRRLGEIEGPKAIALLRTVFAKEPAHRGMHGVPLVKFEVIRTLKKIGTEQAKSALLDILNDYWKRGPKVKDKKSFSLDRDFTTIMSLLLKTSYNWIEEEDFFKTVEIIANSNDVKNFYTNTNGIGQRAWEAYLKGKAIREGIGEEESALYVLDSTEELVGRLSYGTLEYVKYRAAFAVLQKYDKAVLSSLLEKLDTKWRIEDELAPDSERNNELRRKIGFIKAALKEKAKRDKLSPKKAPSATN